MNQTIRIDSLKSFVDYDNPQLNKATIKGLQFKLDEIEKGIRYIERICSDEKVNEATKVLLSILDGSWKVR
jgi:hypothetical protein